MVITSLAHPRRPEAGGEFCDLFLSAPPLLLTILVKDDLGHGSFGGVLVPHPTWLDFCLKSHRRTGQDGFKMNEVPGKSGSESIGGESVNWSPEDEKEPEGLTVQEVPAGNCCL